MTILISSVTSLLVVSILSSLIPGLTRPDLFFAVTVPPEFRRSPDGHRIAKRYQTSGWLGSAVVFALLIAVGDKASAIHIATAGASVVWLGAYFVARHMAQRYAVPTGSVRQAILAPRQDGVPGGRAALAFPFAILALRTLEVNLRWPQIPERFPVHWSFDGPDKWVQRTPLAVYGSLLGVAAICGVLVVLAWSLFHASRQVSATGDNAVTERRFRRRSALGTIVLSWVLALTLPPIPGMYLALPYAPFVVIAAALGSAAVLMASGQGGTRLAGYQPVAGAHPYGDRTPDRYWRLGLFYYNPADPALIVEKRFGIGWTFNFANRWCWIVMALLLGTPILLKLTQG